MSKKAIQAGNDPIMNTISVIIPSYNRARLLPRALDSVLDQSSDPLQVIVVDDGSTDDTVAMLEHEYPRVMLIRQSRSGVSAARNRGIMASRGQWLAFLDSDDQWLPGKLAHQLARIRQQPDCKIIHTDEIWVRRGVRVNPHRKHRKYGGRIFRRCLPLCCISPSSVMIHKSVFDRVGLFDEQLPACEDYDLWLRITATYPVEFIDKPLIIKYGGHEDQLSGQYTAMDRFRIRALRNILETGDLQAGDRAAAIKTLVARLRILANGALKHGNAGLAEQCRRLLQSYSDDKRSPETT